MRTYIWILLVLQCWITALARGLAAAPSQCTDSTAGVHMPAGAAQGFQQRRRLLLTPPAQRSPGWAQRYIKYTASHADALCAAADLNTAPLNSHSFGAFVAAARWTGSQAAATAGGLQLLAGPGLKQAPPVLSEPGPYTNIGFAHVSITGGLLLAPCLDDPNGLPICPQLQVPAPVTLIHYPDASPFLTAANAPPAYLPTPSRLAPTVVSGLVWLDVGGRGSNPPAGRSAQQLTDRFPCSPPGACVATVVVPLSRPLPPGSAYACVRSTTGIPAPVESAAFMPMPSSNTSWWTDTSFGVTGVFESSSQYPPFGAVSCSTTYPGAYAVVAYTIEPVPSSDLATPSDLLSSGNIKHSFRYTLEADYEAVAANATALAVVGEVVQLAAADITGLPLSYLQVTDISKGSVVVDLDVWVPKAFTAAQDKAMRRAALSPKNNWLLSELAAAGIAATEFVEAVETTPTYSRSQVLGLGIGLGVGGGVLVMAAVVLVVVRRRKRAASLAAAAAVATAYKPGAASASP